jgi:hypothetical protein
LDAAGHGHSFWSWYTNNGFQLHISGVGRIGNGATLIDDKMKEILALLKDLNEKAETLYTTGSQLYWKAATFETNCIRTPAVNGTAYYDLADNQKYREDLMLEVQSVLNQAYELKSELFDHLGPLDYYYTDVIKFKALQFIEKGIDIAKASSIKLRDWEQWLG